MNMHRNKIYDRDDFLNKFFAHVRYCPRLRVMTLYVSHMRNDT